MDATKPYEFIGFGARSPRLALPGGPGAVAMGGVGRARRAGVLLAAVLCMVRAACQGAPEEPGGARSGPPGPGGAPEGPRRGP